MTFWRFIKRSPWRVRRRRVIHPRFKATLPYLRRLRRAELLRSSEALGFGGIFATIYAAVLLTGRGWSRSDLFCLIVGGLVVGIFVYWHFRWKAAARETGALIALLEEAESLGKELRELIAAGKE